MSFAKIFTVIEPTGVNIVQQPNTGIWHEANSASCGFKAHFYLTPANVSFSAVSVREMSCLPDTASGYFQSKSNESHAEWPNWRNSTTTVTSLGTRTNVDDGVVGGPYPSPYAVGVFIWKIPLHFQVGSSDTGKEFTKNIHREDIDSNGKLTVGKGSVSHSKNYSDPDSSY
jgi:hypothetical protein